MIIYSHFKRLLLLSFDTECEFSNSEDSHLVENAGNDPATGVLFLCFVSIEPFGLPPYTCNFPVHVINDATTYNDGSICTLNAIAGTLYGLCSDQTYRTLYTRRCLLVELC